MADVASSPLDIQTLQAYMAADPRTKKMVDTQLANVERRRMHGIILEYCGLFSGLLVALLFLWVTYLLVMAGYQIAGTILGTVDLAAVVWALKKRPAAGQSTTSS